MTFGNNQTETLTLNDRFRPEHLTSGPLDITYSYDPAGNVTQIDDARSGFDSSYGYDSLDRLTSVTGFGANSVTYDAQGNRATKTGVTYSYSSTTNRLTSATSSFGIPESGTFTYDNAGNMESDGAGTYTYSTVGMMKTATVANKTTSYDYDAAGARVVKASPDGTRYFIRGPGSLLLAEYDASTGTPVVAREYIYFGTRLLASFNETTPSPTITAALMSPSAGLVTPASATVTVAAAAAASGGASVTSVQFYANGQYIGGDSSAPYEASWTPSAAGEYRLSARAVASTGKVANSVAIPLTVSAVGRVLDVSVWPSSPVSGQLATVQVDGNAYTCGAVQVNFGDGTVTTYPHSGSLQSAPLQVTHTWSSSGSKTVTATGQGNCLGQDSVGATVAGNDQPTVSWTAPAASSKHVTGNAITMSASASDGQGVSSVEFYDGTTLLASDTSAPWSYSWTNATEGSHTIKVKAIDAYGLASTVVERSIDVQDIDSAAVSPTVPISGQAALVTVYGAATGCGAVQVNYGDGDVVTYAIESLPISNYHTWTTGGQKTVTVTGQSTCSGSWQGTVTVNAAPTVTLTSPANNDTFYAPATVSLAATASDSDGSVASVKFYAGSTLLETDTSSPYSYSWSGMSDGMYSITAVVTDNQGATTSTSAIGVSIGQPASSTVTGVSVSSSTVGTYTWVTVTVTGGNPCGAVAINFGDGDAPYLPIESLPYQRSKYWTEPGTYTITATGQSYCTGQASTQITVTSEPDVLNSTQEDTWTAIAPFDLPTAAASVALESDDEPATNLATGAAFVSPVTITLDIPIGVSGTVTSSPSGFNCSGHDTTCTATFESGTSVTLTATPGSGQTFLGWGGACVGTSSCVFTASDGVLVTATFSGGSSATISYYHADVLGSVRAITGSGSEVTRHDYFPFGETTSSLTGDPRKFLGAERDAETAFDAMGARYYRNVWGRFTSVDPIFTTAVTDPQRWNRYAYALNNPLRYVDPTGLDADATHDNPTDEGSGHCSAICGELDGWADEYVYLNENIDGLLALERQWDAKRTEKERLELYKYRTNIENQMLKAEIWPLIASYSWTGHMFVGRFTKTSDVVKQLALVGNFKGPGWAYGLHKSVGPNPQDYRSRGGSLGPGSMQVVFSHETSAFHIDVDKYSPYDGLVSLFAHGLLEVVPHLRLPSFFSNPVNVR